MEGRITEQLLPDGIKVTVYDVIAHPELALLASKAVFAHPDLSPLAKLVFARIHSFSAYGNKCILSNERMSKELGATTRGIQKALKTLDDHLLIDRRYTVEGELKRLELSTKIARNSLKTSDRTNKVHPPHEQSSPEGTNKVHHSNHSSNQFSKGDYSKKRKRDIDNTKKIVEATNNTPKIDSSKYEALKEKVIKAS